MSSPSAPADKSKPVVKEKNPHNYRKVGYCMIVISVFLVIIGLLVWSIGSNYHYASNIMASQEVDAMTPKSGYNIVLFDYSQPIGAKLKLLDHADSADAAHKLQTQETQNTGTKGQVLILDNVEPNNLNIMANAEVAAMTPKQGYNVILFNNVQPVGAKLTLGIHEDLIANATRYEQQQVDQITDKDVKVVIFTPSFTDNLKIVTGSSIPVEAFAALANNQTSTAPSLTQTAGNPSAGITSPTTTKIPPTIISNQTVTNVEKPNTNATISITPTKSISNQTGVNPEKTTVNATATAGVSKSITLNENVGITTTGK